MMVYSVMKNVQVFVHVLKDGDLPIYGQTKSVTTGRGMATEETGVGTETYGESGWEKVEYLDEGGFRSAEHGFESEAEVAELLLRAMEETDAVGFTAHISFEREMVGLFTHDRIRRGMASGPDTVMEGTAEAVASGLVRWATVRDVMVS